MKRKDAEFLTTQQLARLWDVSEATIKRWADAGRLRPSKTIGGHRRFALAEVMRFQKAHALDARIAAQKSVRASALAEALKTANRADTARGLADTQARFFESIITGWTDTAISILLKAYLDKIPLAKILDQMITGAMHSVGDAWHSGQMTVADEHLATRTMMRTLEGISNLLKPEQPAARRALCCAVEDELHEVAVHCVQILLESEGWEVVNLGANTPFFTLATAVEKHRPALVCISSTMNTALERSAREYPQVQAAARKCGARLALGGEGFLDQRVRQRFPANLHAENFSQLLDFIQQEESS